MNDIVTSKEEFLDICNKYGYFIPKNSKFIIISNDECCILINRDFWHCCHADSTRFCVVLYLQDKRTLSSKIIDDIDIKKSFTKYIFYVDNDSSNWTVKIRRFFLKFLSFLLR